jgi:hypothetical protein
VFFTVILAPLTAAPLGSVTVPLILAVVWANAVAVKHVMSSIHREKAIFLDIRTPLLKTPADL